MMKIFRDSERGQVFVILVVAIVGLVGLTALAIDGGMAYSDRRNAQNAADAAAMAGAYAGAHDPSTITKDPSAADSIWGYARARAHDNGFDQANTPDQTVEVNYPPADGTYAGNPAYVQVKISSVVHTSLIHFVFGGEVRNRVESVAHFTFAKEGPLFGGNGLVSLAPHKCPALWANGNFTIKLDVGGIFVNSDGKDCGFGEVVEGNSNAKEITAPSLSSVGSISEDFLNKGTVNIGTVSEGVDPYPYPPGIKLVDPPDCSEAIEANWDSGTKTYSVVDPTKPAKIPGGLGNKFDGTLGPGVYCIPASGFSFNAQANWTADGAMLFITGTHPCDWGWNGGAEFHLFGPGTTGASTQPDCPGDGTDDLTCQYKGIVIYVDPNNFNSWPDSAESTINGGAGSEFAGTIYAPTCSAKYNGSSDQMSFHGQIISYDFELVGGASLKIIYNDQDAGKGLIPASTELAK